MSIDTRIAEGFKILWDKADLPGLRLLQLQADEVEPGAVEGTGFVLPPFEGDIVSLQISKPVITVPLGKKPSATVQISIEDPSERAATFYGVIAGIHLHGSPLPEVYDSLSFGWKGLYSQHGIEWETAKPHVLTAWKAVDYLLFKGEEK